jgi:hypothetical protein
LLAVQVDLPFIGIGQAIPHLPQLSDALVVSTQAPPQLARPPAHRSVHFDWSQTWLAEHDVVQPPQRAGSVLTSTQAPPHSANGASHTIPH